jgi:hypothetical protein
VSGTSFDPGFRDHHEIEALVTDRYLESILAAHARGADVTPILVDARPDGPIEAMARRLSRDLPRFHPSFRFEEALAARLHEAAMRMHPTEPPLVGELPLLLADRRSPAAAGTPGDHDRVILLGDPRLVIGRPWLVGGALTSAALSLAGAVFVAWRIRRPVASPMARAARAVARARLS